MLLRHVEYYGSIWNAKVTFGGNKRQATTYTKLALLPDLEYGGLNAVYIALFMTEVSHLIFQKKKTVSSSL